MCSLLEVEHAASVFYSNLNKVKKILAVLLRKREIKAMRELDIFKHDEEKTQKINETSFSSFFKITTQYDMKNDETRGDTIIDPNFTIYQYR